MKKLTLITAILMTANLLLGQWYQLPNPYPNDDTLREIYFIDQDHGFIGGHWNSSYDGFMHSSSDGGFTWDYYLQWIELHPYRILFLDENNGWFIEGGAQAPWFDKSKKMPKSGSGVWHTSDGGKNADSWEELDATGLSEFGMESIFFTDSLNGWICGWDYGWMRPVGYVYSSLDGGNSWSKSRGPLGIVNDIFFINDSVGWFVGEGGKVTSDKGETWEDIETDCYGQVIQFIDENTGWIGGNTGFTGVIVKSTDGGNTWEQKVSDSIPKINDLQFVDLLHGWAVGDSGTILYTDDAGETWEYQESGTNADLRKLCFVDVNNGWICGLGGTILYTDNGGITVGIKEDSKNPIILSVYPNPVNDRLFIDFDLENDANVIFEMYTISGKRIKALNEKPNTTGNNHLEMNTQDLLPGTYFLRLQAGNEFVTEKIVKL